MYDKSQNCSGAEAGEDSFEKVQVVITDMINRLQEEASSEANQKSYFDEETSKALGKKEDLETDVSKHSSKLGSAVDRRTILNGEISALQSELGVLSRRQLRMDTMRADEKRESSQGLRPIWMALDTIRNYYGASFVQQTAAPEVHQSAGSGGRSLRAISPHIWRNFVLQRTRRRLLTRRSRSRTRSQGVKYKEQESASLKRPSGELASYRDVSNAELSSVVQYLAKLGDMCGAKADTNEEKVRSCTAEIARRRLCPCCLTVRSCKSPRPSIGSAFTSIDLVQVLVSAFFSLLRRARTLQMDVSSLCQRHFNRALPDCCRDNNSSMSYVLRKHALGLTIFRLSIFFVCLAVFVSPFVVNTHRIRLSHTSTDDGWHTPGDSAPAPPLVYLPRRNLLGNRIRM